MAGRKAEPPIRSCRLKSVAGAVGSLWRFWLTFAALILASPFAGAQTYWARFQRRSYAGSEADVNPTTNKIYVANRNSNNVTVIDGSTNATTTVAKDRLLRRSPSIRLSTKLCGEFEQ